MTENPEKTDIAKTRKELQIALESKLQAHSPTAQILLIDTLRKDLAKLRAEATGAIGLD